MDLDKKIMLITEKLKLKDIYPEKAKEISKKYKLKEDDIELIRKGITPADLEIKEGERAVISYITTGAIDRDHEIMEPSGAVLTEYKKHPVVLFVHNYKELPIGKNEWIKQDEKGLIAKTIYAKHKQADEVFQYRKDGFPLAESIGFIGLKHQDYDSDEQEKNGGVVRRYTKWMLLEYSDVPVPCNPEARQIAVAKGWIPKEKIYENWLPVVKVLKAEMAASLGARGTEKDEMKYKILSLAYKQLGLEIPEWKEYGEEELKEIFNEVWFDELGDIVNLKMELKDKEDALKTGRVLSEKNRNLVKRCSDMLIELYNASEPPKSEEEGKGKKEIKDAEKIVDCLNKMLEKIKS